jgi:hypothetical protein
MASHKPFGLEPHGLCPMALGTAVCEVPRPEERYSMNSKAKIRSSTLGVIIGLVISVWWIFMGLDIGFRFEVSDVVSYWLTIGGYRHTIMTILALILIPMCALEKRRSFLAAMVLGITTLTLSVVHVVYMLITAPSGYESQLFGPVIWSVIQIPIIVFSYRARLEPAKEAIPGSGI